MPASVTAADFGLGSCHVCGYLSRAERPGPGIAWPCPRCGANVRLRRFKSIGQTGALLLAAAICYLPANIMPVLITTTAEGTEADTILGGVARLYASGSWILSLVVLIASVMIPIGKMAVLAYLLIVVTQGAPTDRRQCMRLFRIVEFIGRWSMLDVFVDAFIVALVQLGPLMSVAPGPGVPFFAATAVLTMSAAIVFDPRLLWDRDRVGRIDDGL
ncbi:MAG TPA: paraquat-inducible protein A [Usitatibacteraceae bacterium]